MPTDDPGETPEERFRRAGVEVTDRLRKHVLDGDKKGRGHRYSTQRANKTVFPQDWDDDHRERHRPVIESPKLVQARGPFLCCRGRG